MDMQRQNYLIVCAIEEAGELIQALSKTMRFGPENWHPETGITNKTSIEREANDLLALLHILSDQINLDLDAIYSQELIERKHEKLKHWMEKG